MPPGGGGGGESGCTAQEHPPAPVRRDEDAPPHSTPPLPDIAPLASQDNEQKQYGQPAAASLPEGPLVEILARVPYRSLCRFKSVSKPWLALCSSRDIHKRSPQTLAGFFGSLVFRHTFRNLSGRGPPLFDPSLPFLGERFYPPHVLDFCGGLLLCRCSRSRGSDIVVCNPATEQWTILPPIRSSGREFGLPDDFYLGFDAAVPSSFVVFAPLARMSVSEYLAIYSSQTGQWNCIQKKSACPSATFVAHFRNTRVFLNATIHLTTHHKSIVTTDTEGKIWREIKKPDEFPCKYAKLSIGQSKGRLYAWQIVNSPGCQLYISVLEDYDTAKWTLKHTVNVLELFGRHCRSQGRSQDNESYTMFALHPDCNVIFLTDGMRMTLSYDLDDRKVHVICRTVTYGLPYIPCFADLPSAGH